MNFYFLFFFVILCFGPSDAAQETYHHLRKTSVGAREETKRKLNGDAGFSIINGLIRAKHWVHLFRRLLKSLRKWCNTHPPEVKLGKCFVSYFNIKIPGLRRYEKKSRYYEGLEEAEYPTKTLQPKQKTITECENQKRIFQKTSFGINFLLLAQRTFIKIMKRFREYHDIILKNDLLVCLWNYFWKKFWIWVDSAPDVRFRV